MADTKATAQPAAAAATPAKKKTVKPRNYDLGNGVYRFSRTRMFHKKAIYKFLDKKTPKAVRFVIERIKNSGVQRHYKVSCCNLFAPQVKPKKPVTIEKKINGDKNGGTRIVRLRKQRANYPTSDPVTVHHAKQCFRDHRRYVRPSLVPGTVCILLAGPHKGKRVVLLKKLASGLLLVNGESCQDFPNFI